jgi:serine protease
MPGDITVTAKADANYSLAGDAIWSYTFTDTDCPEKVKPPRVLFDDFCGLKDDMFTVPSRRGVEYRINGQTVQAGTYPASGTVTVTAFAQDNFKLKGMKTSWTHTFKDQECGGNGGTETTPVTPANVDFRDLTCTTAGSYTVPVTEGVVYKDATGKTIIAGTYPVLTAANLTITAYPLDDTVSLAGTTQWQHAFASPANCGHVLGESTSTPVSPSGFVFVPGGKGAAPELANTGAETLPAAISASLIVLAAVAVYAVNPRKNSAR